MRWLLDILTIASLGLLAGTEFAVSAFVNPVVWKPEDRAQANSFSEAAGREHKRGDALHRWRVLAVEVVLISSLLGIHH